MHEDISYPSEVLPFTLYHVFNSAYCNEVTKSNYPFVADSSNMPLGTGWKLNVMGIGYTDNNQRNKISGIQRL